MTLQRDASGSQRFQPPDVGAAFDFQGLLNPTGPLGSSRPLAGADFDPPVWLDTAPNGDRLYKGRLTIRDWRGNPRQEGRFEECYASMSSGDMVGDEWDIARHALLTTAQATALPDGTVDRCWTTEFLSIPVTGFYSTPATVAFIFREASTTDPAMAAVTGYVVPAATTLQLCGASFQCLGIHYLGIGFQTGANTLQVLSNLNNPPTSIVLAVGADATYGLCQIPGPGQPVVVYNGSNLKFFKTDVAIGAITITTVAAGLAPGGYMVGMVALGGGAPYIAVVVPTSGAAPMLWGGGGWGVGGAGPGTGAPTERGEVRLFDLNGYERGILRFAGLPFVSIATNVNGAGVFACDRHSHYYHQGGTNPIAVDLEQDYAPDSNRQRVCCGHRVVGSKVQYEINEINTANSTTTSRRLVMEYDPRLNTRYQVSATKEMAGTGVKSITGPNLPFSNQSRYATVLSGSATSGYSWYRQEQPFPNMLGFNMRKSAGASASTGSEYEATAYAVTPRFTSYPGLKGKQLFATGRVTAPSIRNIAYGEERDANGVPGTFTTGASMTVTDVGGGVSWPFTTREPYDQRPVAADETPSNAWADYMQFRVDSTRQTGGVDPSHYTPNVLPITVDVFIKVKGDVKAGNWQEWGTA